MPRSAEPLWWGLFSAGGMLAALFFPVLIVLTGFLIPFGIAGEAEVGFERVYPVLSHPLTRVALAPVIALPLFHWAHRFVHTLIELGLRRSRRVLAVLSYGAAVLGTVLTVVVLWRL